MIDTRNTYGSTSEQSPLPQKESTKTGIHQKKIETPMNQSCSPNIYDTLYPVDVDPPAIPSQLGCPLAVTSGNGLMRDKTCLESQSISSHVRAERHWWRFQAWQGLNADRASRAALTSPLLCEQGLASDFARPSRFTSPPPPPALSLQLLPPASSLSVHDGFSRGAGVDEGPSKVLSGEEDPPLDISNGR
eukprot:763730-Hanusia_phi.AAC.4